MVGLQKCTLHSEDRFGVHCIAIVAGIQGIPIWPIRLNSEDRFGVHCIAIVAGIQGIPIWPIRLIIICVIWLGAGVHACKLNVECDTSHVLLIGIHTGANRHPHMCIFVCS